MLKQSQAPSWPWFCGIIIHFNKQLGHSEHEWFSVRPPHLLIGEAVIMSDFSGDIREQGGHKTRVTLQQVSS